MFYSQTFRIQLSYTFNALTVHFVSSFHSLPVCFTTTIIFILFVNVSFSIFILFELHPNLANANTFLKDVDHYLYYYCSNMLAMEHSIFIVIQYPTSYIDHWWPLIHHTLVSTFPTSAAPFHSSIQSYALVTWATDAQHPCFHILQ